MPGSVLINKATGRREVYYGDDALRALNSGGYEVAPDSGVNVVSPVNTVESIRSEEELAARQSEFGPGYRPLPAEASHAREAAAYEASLYNSPEHAIRAFGQGVLSIPTLGLSDFAFDDAAVLARQRGGYRLAGNVVGAIPLAFASGGGLSGALGGGLRGMAAEGAAFGFGQGVSNLALSNEPLTAESVVSELVSSTATGGLFGLGGGLAAKGLGKAAGKLRGFSQNAAKGEGLAKLANETLDLSSEEATHWAREVRRVSGATDDFVKRFAEVEEKVAPKAAADGVLASPFNKADAAGAERTSRGMVQDVLSHLDEQAAQGVPGAKTLSGKLRTKLRNFDDEIASLGEGKRDAFGRPPHRQEGGQAWFEDVLKTPENRLKFAKTAKAMRDTALEYGEKAGWSEAAAWRANMGTPPRVEVDALVGNRTVGDPLYNITKYLENPAAAEALAVAPKALEQQGSSSSLRSLQKSYRKAWGLGSSDVLPAEALNRFANQELPDALHSLETMTAYHDALRQAGAVKQVDEVSSALARMGEKNETWQAVDPAELLAKVGFQDVEKLQAIGKSQPDLLKFWLANGAVKAEKAAAAAQAAKYGGPVGRFFIRRGAGMLGASMAGPLGYIGGEVAASLLMSSPRMAAATGRTTARIATALDKIAKGVSKPAAQRSALDILNAINPTDKGKNLHEAYKKRANEIAQLASNPATQENIANSLADVGAAQTSLGVTDKAIVHAHNAVRYLNDQAPKDPGEIQTLGKTRWRTTEADINKWANMVRAVLDPVSVVEGVASGTVSPAAVHALKETAPATYEELQRQFLRRLPEIQQNATYDQQVRMGILFGVPANSTMRPDFVNFIQQGWAEKPQPMKIESSAKPEQPTKAQQLLGM